MYLDASSGAPLHPVAREALVAALAEGWADPARLYGAARRARRQPVGAAAAACAAAGVPPHVDAAQSVGRTGLLDGWSLLSASAHKWGGPPGVGVLVVRAGTRWVSPLPADERERGRVPGFEN